MGNIKTFPFYFQNNHKRLKTMTELLPEDQVNSLESEGQVAGMSVISRDRLEDTESEL